MADFIPVSICVSDIPRSAIKVADNGKKYINIVVAERAEVGRYGETHSVFMSQSKEEREQKAAKCYIGNGKAYQPKETTAPVTAEQVENMPSVSEVEAVGEVDVDDLPF